MKQFTPDREPHALNILRTFSRGPALTFGPAFLALALTLVVSSAVHRESGARSRARFEREAHAMSATIHDWMGRYEVLVRATASFLAADPTIDQQQFHEFVERLRLPERFPGLQGIGFNPRVDAGDRSLFTLQVRARGRPGFRVDPEGEGAVSFPVLYLEPGNDRNLAALGYDVWSEPVRRAAMERARDSGEPAATGMVTLRQETTAPRQQGFLIYTPVYRGRGDPGTVEGRRAALAGFVSAPFRVEDMLNGACGRVQHARVGFTVYEGAALGPLTRLHGSAGSLPGRRGRFSTSAEILVAGRTWTLAFASGPQFEAGEASAWAWVLVFGLLVTVVVFWSTGREHRLRVLAEDAVIKADLAHAEQRRAIELQHSLDSAIHARDAMKHALAVVSHELRNPITALRLITECLDDEAPPPPDRWRRDLAKISGVAAMMMETIDTLLDGAKLDAGRPSWNWGDVPLEAACAEAVHTVEPLLYGRNCDVWYEVAPGAVSMRGDRGAIRRLLVNLVANACRHTADGGVRISVSRAARVGGDWVEIQVADSGGGMTEEVVQTLGTPFATVEGPHGSPRCSGTGLGLSICRAIAAAHGGSISVATRLGVGTVFTVRMRELAAPVTTADPPPPIEVVPWPEGVVGAVSQPDGEALSGAGS